MFWPKKFAKNHCVFFFFSGTFLVVLLPLATWDPDEERVGGAGTGTGTPAAAAAPSPTRHRKTELLRGPTGVHGMQQRPCCLASLACGSLLPARTTGPPSTGAATIHPLLPPFTRSPQAALTADPTPRDFHSVMAMLLLEGRFMLAPARSSPPLRRPCTLAATLALCSLTLPCFWLASLSHSAPVAQCRRVPLRRQ